MPGSARTLEKGLELTALTHSSIYRVGRSRRSGHAGRHRPARLVALLFIAAFGLVGVAEAPPAEAAVSTVIGSACGYYVNVGLFGGPQSRMGCEPQISRHGSAPVGASTLSPSVQLPPTGSASPITATDSDGAAAKYGPATIFGGIWPFEVATPPPSGPITVSTQGTTGANGSVTSSTDITLLATPKPVACWGDPAGTTNCRAPGGFGPAPVWGDALHVECSASEGAVSGSTTFTNSFIAKATDPDGEPLPSATEAIPTNPPPNYTRSGVITNVGDVFTAVFNEQIRNADGSLTVNAVHMYLFGPVAVGDMVKGQVTCGTNPTSVPVRDTIAPHCGIPVVAPVSPQDPTPKVPREELIGVFDAGGLQAISNIQITNGTVRVGMLPNDDADPNNDYLKFTPGMKGPLTMVATRTNEAFSMTWSFDATDAAGTVSHCVGAVPPPAAIITGFTWYSDGSSSKSGPSGTIITAYGTGLFTNRAYKLVTAPVQADPDRVCLVDVVYVNNAVRLSNSSGLVANTSGRVNRAPGNYHVCLLSQTGSLIGAPLLFQVTG